MHDPHGQVFYTQHSVKTSPVHVTSGRETRRSLTPWQRLEVRFTCQHFSIAIRICIPLYIEYGETICDLDILSFCLIEMGVMPEIAQALEEMDWLCVKTVSVRSCINMLVICALLKCWSSLSGCLQTFRPNPSHWFWAEETCSWWDHCSM